MRSAARSLQPGLPTPIGSSAHLAPVACCDTSPPTTVRCGGRVCTPSATLAAVAGRIAPQGVERSACPTACLGPYSPCAASAHRHPTECNHAPADPCVLPGSPAVGAVRCRTQRLLHLHWLAGAQLLCAAATPRGSPAPQAVAAAAALAGAAVGRDGAWHGTGACWCGPIKWHNWRPNGRRRQRDATRAPWKPCRHSVGLGTGQPVPAQCPAA